MKFSAFRFLFSDLRNTFHLEMFCALKFIEAALNTRMHSLYVCWLGLVSSIISKHLTRKSKRKYFEYIPENVFFDFRMEHASE